MPKDRFWQIVENARQESGQQYEAQLERIAEALQQLSPADIVAFDNTRRLLMAEAYDWQLWAAAYIINDGCSDDCFEDFCGWLICHGRSVFKNTLNNPDSLAELSFDDEEVWEGFAYCASDAYREKTRNDMPKGKNVAAHIKGQEWEESDLPSMLPRLARKYEYK